MYPNYPHDSEQQHLDTCQRAVEGDLSHVLLQSGTVTLNLTANAPTTITGTFPRPFTPSTVPDMHGVISNIGSATGATIKNIVISATNNATFNVTVTSDSTHTVTVTWFAKGQAS